MNPFWKDVIQATTWIVAVLGGIVTAALSIHERWSEFRWRRADKAKELIDQIHRHPLACQAVHMLDWHDTQVAIRIWSKKEFGTQFPTPKLLML